MESELWSFVIALRILPLSLCFWLVVGSLAICSVSCVFWIHQVVCNIIVFVLVDRAIDACASSDSNSISLLFRASILEVLLFQFRGCKMCDCVWSAEFSAFYRGALFLLLDFFFAAVEDVWACKLISPGSSLLLWSLEHVLIDDVWVTPVWVESFGIHFLSSTCRWLWVRSSMCNVVSWIQVANLFLFGLVSDVCCLYRLGICALTSLH